MNKYTAKRKRRQAKQALKYGSKAKPKHRLKTGRTGHVTTSRIKNFKRGKAWRSSVKSQKKNSEPNTRITGGSRTPARSAQRLDETRRKTAVFREAR